MKQSVLLSPNRQEDILKKVATNQWESIPYSDPNGREIMQLLEAIRDMCLLETVKPNAPYAPGVTGFAISMRDQQRLIDKDYLKNRPEYVKLSRIISSCISNNYLEVYLDRRQGPRDSGTWMLMYLNRMVCLYFGLSLNYGGWRPLKLDKLCEYAGLKELEKKERKVFG